MISKSLLGEGQADLLLPPPRTANPRAKGAPRGYAPSAKDVGCRVEGCRVYVGITEGCGSKVEGSGMGCTVLGYVLGFRAFCGLVLQQLTREKLLQ